MKSTPFASFPAVLGAEPIFPVPIPMAAPRLPAAATMLPRWQAILESGQLTKGPELAAFEAESASALKVPYAVGVASCTSGLILALDALRRRLKRAQLGSPLQIAVPSFTFMASVAAIVRAGFEPLFVEVSPDTMNLDLQDLREQLAAHKPAAVLGVHCFGNPLPETELVEICDEFDCRLMVDAAHAFGSRQNGKPLGRMGWCQVFSLTPTKMVVAAEGGIVATEDASLVEELKVSREYGNDGQYGSQMAGLNARLSELHAALARCSLEMLEEVVEHRNQTAQAYFEGLRTIRGLGFQEIAAGDRTTYKDLTVRVDPQEFGCSRNAVAWALLREGIPTRTYFSPPCHQHVAYRSFAQRALPRTEELAERCLSLPLLDESTVAPITDALSRIQAHGPAIQELYERESSSKP